MRQLPVRLATRLVLLWARVYTLGLSPVLRRHRVDLLRSDLWEESSDLTRSRPSSLALALAILGRAARGVSADLSWRLFDAKRQAVAASPGVLDPAVLMSRSVMSKLNLLPFIAVTTGIAWAIVVVLVLQPVSHSLAYVAAFVGLVALGGWSLEARERADVEGDGEAGASAWPLLLALAIALFAGGVVFDAGRAGLLPAVPLAFALSVAFTRELGRGSQPESDADIELVSGSELEAAARDGAAIAIESRGLERGVSRRTLLRGSATVGLFSLVAAAGGVVTDFLYRRNVSGFGAVIAAGPVSRFPPGTKTRNIEGKFWPVNLTEEQGGPGFLALWQRCPHLGCVVPWEERFNFTDPQTNQMRRGWFRCGCHQSTYNDAGVRVYGPANRSMDRMALTISPEGIIEVNTGDITDGTPDNATYAVKPQEVP